MEMVGHGDERVNINTVGLGKVGKAISDDVFVSVFSQHILPFQTCNGQKLGMLF